MYLQRAVDLVPVGWYVWSNNWSVLSLELRFAVVWRSGLWVEMRRVPFMRDFALFGICMDIEEQSKERLRGSRAAGNAVDGL